MPSLTPDVLVLKTTLGHLFDSPERAQATIDYMQDRLDRVASGLADAAEADKPTVLVIQYSDEGAR